MAANGALPPGWATKSSRGDGATYYVNTHTGETTFDVPQQPALPPGSSPNTKQPKSQIKKRPQKASKASGRWCGAPETPRRTRSGQSQALQQEARAEAPLQQAAAKAAAGAPRRSSGRAGAMRSFADQPSKRAAKPAAAPAAERAAKRAAKPAAQPAAQLTAKIDAVGGDVLQLTGDPEFMRGMRNLTIGLGELFGEIYPAQTAQ